MTTAMRTLAGHSGRPRPERPRSRRLLPELTLCFWLPRAASRLFPPFLFARIPSSFRLCSNVRCFLAALRPRGKSEAGGRAPGAGKGSPESARGSADAEAASVRDGEPKKRKNKNKTDRTEPVQLSQRPSVSSCEHVPKSALRSGVPFNGCYKRLT